MDGAPIVCNQTGSHKLVGILRKRTCTGGGENSCAVPLYVFNVGTFNINQKYCRFEFPGPLI